jgi:predicted RND superfamily exporter protein
MNALVRFRWVGLVVLILAVVGVLRGVETAMVPDNAMSVWFLESDPTLAQYREFQERFGNDEVVLIHMHFPDGVYAAEALSTLRALGTRLEAVDGVERVYSAAHTLSLAMTPKGPTLAPAFPDDLGDPKALARAAAPLKDSPLVVGHFVNESADQAMMWVEMEVSADFDARRDSIIGAVRSTAAEVLGDQDHHVAGIGVLYTGLNEVTEKDFGTFLGLGYLLLFGAMGWVFRSVIFTFTALLVVAVATLVMFGIYGLMGNQLNMVTSVLPIVVMVLGIADVVHFPAAFVRHRRAHPELPKRDIAVAALKDVFWPCVLTTVTTVAGFLALTSAPMAVVRDLGLYTAIGVSVALLASLVLMAIAFLLVREKVTLPSHKRIDAFTDRFRALVQQRTGLAWALIGAVVVVAGVGASRVDVDTYTLGYLPDDHAVVTDHHAIEDAWGSYNVLEFMVRPAKGRSVDDPAILTAMGTFVKRAMEDEWIRDGVSLDTLYRQMVPGGAESKPLTDDQLKLLPWDKLQPPIEWDRTKAGFRDNALAAFRTEDGSVGRIKLIGGMLSANQLSDLLERMERLAGDIMGDLGTIEASGYLPLYTQIIDYVMTSQTRSFALALGLIFLIMLIGLRSIRLALISIVPNLFPVLVMFAVMGFAGIDLDIATASIAAIVIGVSIDDTVHFLWAWREAEQRGMGWDDALVYTYDHAGRPAVITTILLVAGYAVLMAGSGATVFYFGLLTTVAATAALVGDLVLLPLLLKPFTRPVTA